MTRERMPEPVERALTDYRAMRLKHGMCALWTCPRQAADGLRFCAKHDDFYKRRKR